MDALDALLILVAALLAAGGLRVGFLAGAPALAAAVIGATAAVAVVPHLVVGLAPWAGHPQVMTVTTLASALVVAAGAGWIVARNGRRLRNAISGQGRPRIVDAAAGGLAMGAVCLITAASLAPLAIDLPLANAASATAVTAQVRDSQVVQAIHAALPAASTDLLSPYTALLATAHQPPQVRSDSRTVQRHASDPTTPHTTTTAAPMLSAPVGPEVTDAILRDAASVVRIVGNAPVCGITQEGSGFVVAPAGTDQRPRRGRGDLAHRPGRR